MWNFAKPFGAIALAAVVAATPVVSSATPDNPPITPASKNKITWAICAVSVLTSEAEKSGPPPDSMFATAGNIAFSLGHAITAPASDASNKSQFSGYETKSGIILFSLHTGSSVTEINDAMNGGPVRKSRDILITYDEKGDPNEVMTVGVTRSHYSRNIASSSGGAQFNMDKDGRVINILPPSPTQTPEEKMLNLSEAYKLTTDFRSCYRAVRAPQKPMM